MNAQISVFVICVEAITYLLLYNLRDCTFKWDKLLMVVDYLIFFFEKEKVWLNMILLYFYFFVLFSNFWMSNVWVYV